MPGALAPDEETALREILGYLNFSNGTPDARFQRNFGRLHAALVMEAGRVRLARILEERLAVLEQQSSAFHNSEQARGVIRLVFDDALPAYRRHHADLLFHLGETDFLQSFFLARVAEAVLAQGTPWEETERIVGGALGQLNDFLGHRPVAVLENGRQMLPYPHERFRPIPLYLRGAGTAPGPYHDLIAQALAILEQMPAEILSQAYFDLNLLDEIALDVRAYDHSHPVYKRTNYTFGEWDPHCLDISGRYRRFVIRAVILDALGDWLSQSSEVPLDERLCEAAAVLGGTILMASSVSGSGPDTHDSSVSLTSLLPKIARQRDAFYTRLLSVLPGRHGERLRKEAQVVQQPFGRIRQHLNLFLAHYGCRQMQRAHLAFLFAHMGYPEAARQQSAVIPSAATRFETELQLRITLVQLALNRGQIARGAQLCGEAEELLHRGIDCGALVDPWNILGFQGQFPLFSAREDGVADQRVDKLLALMDQLFNVMARLSCEAAAVGDADLCESVGTRFQRIADFWDRFATTTVSDLPAVNGGESYQSAALVTQSLMAWHKAGESAGDVAFWKQHVDQFQSPRSYAIVVELLLGKRDTLAAMNLLIQWLSQSDEVPLEAGAYSFFGLLQSWVTLVLQQPPAQAGPLVRKFFDYLEVNAGEWGSVPAVRSSSGGALQLADAPPGRESSDAGEGGAGFAAMPLDDEDPEGSPPNEEDSTFSAAYENFVYRDSAQDGHQGDTLDEAPQQFDTDLDLICQPIELRLRFLVAVSQSWKMAADWALDSPASRGAGENSGAAVRGTPLDSDVVRQWDRQNDQWVRDCQKLMNDLAAWNPAEPDGDPDSLAEYDRQLHVKFSLINTVISACVVLQETSGALRRWAPPEPPRSTSQALDRLTAGILQALSEGDVPAVRRVMPRLLKELSRLPLLYVPLDRDGQPREILAARNLQSLLRLLLMRLPTVGLFRETWHVLRTAYLMERTSPPGGMSITEFDRLLEAALQSTLECLISASDSWEPQPFGDHRLVELLQQVLDMYLRLWLKHSATMRLSSAETLKDPSTWRRVKTFVRKYGGELFHPRMLTMGNLRGIIQRGAEAYLTYLSENEDPLHPVRLLADLDVTIPRGEAAYLLETILRCIVEKFDRFLEYNTTTTQSDYGEQLHCLLDFLRLESDYERQAWNQAPLELAHEVLSRLGRTKAAHLWQETLAVKTSGNAKTFLQKLRRLERHHGMRLPSVTDRVNERFVKPLALDRILALVRPAMNEARDDQPGESFPQLQAEIESYLSTTSGSALEMQPWLQSLADEVQHLESEWTLPEGAQRPDQSVPLIPIDLADVRRQLLQWEKPLDGTAGME
ncbi:MAG: hypothetical protein ACKV0T_21815 [Planctomycetales bacterium]